MQARDERALLHVQRACRLSACRACLDSQGPPPLYGAMIDRITFPGLYYALLT